MLNSFKDIKQRIKEDPTWYDCNGTPRYGKFHPIMSPNIYASQVLLVKIACQACGKIFLVEMNYSMQDEIYLKYPHKFSVDKVPHYGDPPSHPDCSGVTMNCDDLKVVEYWDRDNCARDWKKLKLSRSKK